ncbi:hypothetical protein T265_06663 [Opisthorchis viverrini]|uniref:Reverse transcriptase domain-containing protein n=1 Tax=Opisthorchis viverrini TaxID=6198 RepID=A0A074ZFA4_OPIVI|nr:hypothetical protein T265_06663 [Opisthorchis viverrini]KER25966.1 hypothetical protein T265_06663 [Opisthorchis viverrini]
MAGLALPTQEAILERAGSIQKANPMIRRLSEDRPLDARKLGHNRSGVEARNRLPPGTKPDDPKLMTKPIVVISPCAPESRPTKPAGSPDSMRRKPEGLQNPGVQIVWEEDLVDLEYADDIVLMFEEEEKAQVFLDELTKVIPSFGMHFALTKCRVMLLVVQPLNRPLTIQGEVLEVVERFTYLGSCISSDCSVMDEVDARICKARAAFANLRHLWRQSGASLNTRGRTCSWLNVVTS